MTGHPLRPATRHSLGRPLPHQQADTSRPPPWVRACKQRPSLISSSCEDEASCGSSPGLPRLAPTLGQVDHVLLTRPPLGYREQAPWSSFDLHVLSTPPAFVLSQDQTLRQDLVRWTKGLSDTIEEPLSRFNGVEIYPQRNSWLELLQRRRLANHPATLRLNGCVMTMSGLTRLCGSTSGC